MKKEKAKKELAKLADLIESCDFGSDSYKEYSRAYREIAKQLYPAFDKWKKE